MSSNLKTTLLKKLSSGREHRRNEESGLLGERSESFYKSWSNKANDRTYWVDKDQAKADLDSLDKRIDKAIDQSKNIQLRSVRHLSRIIIQIGIERKRRRSRARGASF